jgi:hypothetical protein
MVVEMYTVVTRLAVLRTDRLLEVTYGAVPRLMRRLGFVRASVVRDIVISNKVLRRIR